MLWKFLFGLFRVIFIIKLDAYTVWIINEIVAHNNRAFCLPQNKG